MKKVYKVLLHVGMIATIIGVSPCWASSGDGEELLKFFNGMPQSEQIKFLTTYAEELKLMQNYDLSKTQNNDLTSWVDDKGQKHWHDKDTGLEHWYDGNHVEHWYGSDQFVHWLDEKDLEHWYDNDGWEHRRDEDGIDRWTEACDDEEQAHWITKEGEHHWTNAGVEHYISKVDGHHYWTDGTELVDMGPWEDKK